MNKDNVIVFPVDKIGGTTDVPQTTEDIKVRTTIMKQFHIQEVVETIMPIIFTQLAIGGFDLSDEADIKDAALITETIRSVLFKRYGMEHPFQKIAEQVFLNEETGILSVAEHLELNFTAQISEDDIEPGVL